MTGDDDDDDNGDDNDNDCDNDNEDDDDDGDDDNDNDDADDNDEVDEDDNEVDGKKRKKTNSAKIQSIPGKFICESLTFTFRRLSQKMTYDGKGGPERLEKG